MAWKRILVTILMVCVIFMLGCDEDEDQGISAEAKAFADEHWLYGGPDVGASPYDNYFQYEYWVATVWGKDGANDTTDDNFAGSPDEWNDLTWTEKRWWLPTTQSFDYEFSPDQKDDDYYINIGVQDQFAPGWDDYTEANFPFDGWRPHEENTPHRDQYLDMIGY